MKQQENNKMTKQEARLRVFAKWLQQDFDQIYEGRFEGFVENLVNSSRKEIGEMLEDILNFDDEQLLKELK